MNSKSRNFCWTLNNYTESDVKRLESLIDITRPKVKYLIFGFELAPSTGTPHLQGYISFHNAVLLKSCKKLISDSCHIEVANGSPIQNREYCNKTTNFKEFGEIPQGEGARSDINEALELRKAGHSIQSLIEKGYNYQVIRMMKMVTPDMPPATTWYNDKKIYWFYGPSGSGKSRRAAELIGEDKYWTCTGNLKWWDGYEPDCKWIWLDDIRADVETFHRFITILDKRPFRAEIKGGTQVVLGQSIIITCPMHPAEFYNKSGEEIKQLIRRIDVLEKITPKHIGREVILAPSQEIEKDFFKEYDQVLEFARIDLKEKGVL